MKKLTKQQTDITLLLIKSVPLLSTTLNNKEWWANQRKGVAYYTPNKPTFITDVNQILNPLTQPLINKQITEEDIHLSYSTYINIREKYTSIKNIKWIREYIIEKIPQTIKTLQSSITKTKNLLYKTEENTDIMEYTYCLDNLSLLLSIFTSLSNYTLPTTN